jgi:hypothetical protein
MTSCLTLLNSSSTRSYAQLLGVNFFLFLLGKEGKPSTSLMLDDSSLISRECEFPLLFQVEFIVLSKLTLNELLGSKTLSVIYSTKGIYTVRFILNSQLFYMHSNLILFSIFALCCSATLPLEPANPTLKKTPRFPQGKPVEPIVLGKTGKKYVSFNDVIDVADYFPEQEHPKPGELIAARKAAKKDVRKEREEALRLEWEKALADDKEYEYSDSDSDDEVPPPDSKQSAPGGRPPRPSPKLDNRIHGTELVKRSMLYRRSPKVI